MNFWNFIFLGLCAQTPGEVSVDVIERIVFTGVLCGVAIGTVIVVFVLALWSTLVDALSTNFLVVLWRLLLRRTCF